jgi:putative tricarboxylic transport membrane protein
MGFGVALTPANLLYCLLGATVGTGVGVLPGIGPVTTIAMLLPITFKMPAVASLIMLCGVYYGAHHAGSTTAIMLNMPGEPTSVVICLDGHPMARKGRAGVALCISAIGSFVAGCVGVIIIALFSPLLATAALSFGSPEYASMVVLALIVACALSGSSMLVTVGMAVLGLLLGTVGTDVNIGILRFTYGAENLEDGLNLIAVVVGFFAFAETAARLSGHQPAQQISTKVNSLIPSRRDFAESWKPIVRGTVLGSLLGILPGTGPLLASFAAYAMERRLARDPSRFGNGAIEGVAGPESANNAAAFTHFIPMLTLGIPAGAAMALLLSAMLIQGITPGPEVMIQHPDLFWGVIASMWIGNMMLLVLNLPLIGVWIRLLMVPYRLLYPAILAFCCIGVYSINNSAADDLLAAGMGCVGYLMKQLGCNPAPLVLALVLSPLLEQNVRRSMQMSRGDPTIFFTRPVSLGLLILAALLVVVLTKTMARGKDKGIENQDVAR